MTKKLDKMMKSRTKKKTKRRKKVPAKDRAKHRGVVFAVGEKRAMEVLYDVIRFQGHKVPAINLFMDDPAADFCINMYSEIASWDYKHLTLFIKEITGKPPAHTEMASLLGTSKSIFHALFIDEEETTKAHLLRYDSKWKMWPGTIRLRPKRRRKSKMATKKAKRKSKKKASTKRAATKKTAARRGKKKAAKKAAGNGRANSISVHEGKVTKLLKRRSGASVMEVVDSVGISKKSVRKLFGSLKAKPMDEVGRYHL